MAKDEGFAVGNRVLCYHGPLLYEAKVVSIKSESASDNHDGAPLYLVHYKGWKRKWDEWVLEERMVKHDKQGLELSKRLRSSLGREQLSDLESPLTGPESWEDVTTLDCDDNPKLSTSNTEPHSLDHRNDDDVMHLSKVAIPKGFKSLIAEDWDLVSRQNMLYQLPAHPCVAEILEDFAISRDGDKGFSEFCTGLIDYFNLALGHCLLFRFERHQYLKLYSSVENFEAAKVYGFQHLCRLVYHAHEKLDYDRIFRNRCQGDFADTFETHLVTLMNFLLRRNDRFSLASSCFVPSDEYFAEINLY